MKVRAMKGKSWYLSIGDNVDESLPWMKQAHKAIQQRMDRNHMTGRGIKCFHQNGAGFDVTWSSEATMMSVFSFFYLAWADASLTDCFKWRIRLRGSQKLADPVDATAGPSKRPQAKAAGAAERTPGVAPKRRRAKLVAATEHASVAAAKGDRPVRRLRKKSKVRLVIAGGKQQHAVPAAAPTPAVAAKSRLPKHAAPLVADDGHKRSRRLAAADAAEGETKQRAIGKPSSPVVAAAPAAAAAQLATPAFAAAQPVTPVVAAAQPLLAGAPTPTVVAHQWESYYIAKLCSDTERPPDLVDAAFHQLFELGEQNDMLTKPDCTIFFGKSFPAAEAVTIKSWSSKDWSLPLREVTMIARCQHPNIVRLMDVFMGRRVWVVLEDNGHDLLPNPHASTWIVMQKVPQIILLL